MITRLLVLLASLLCASLAEANYWSSPASGCTPDSKTIKNAGIEPVGHSGIMVEPASGYTQDVELHCPVSFNHGAPNPLTLSMTYRDSSGPGAASRVTAQLFRVSRAGIQSVSTLALVSSDNFPETQRVQHHVKFTHALDFKNNYYYVRIILRRSGKDVLEVYGVALD